MPRYFPCACLTTLSLMVTVSGCGDIPAPDLRRDLDIDALQTETAQPSESPITGVPVCEQAAADDCLPAAAFQFVYVDWVGTHTAVRLGRLDGTRSRPIVDFFAGVATTAHVDVSARGDRLVWVDWNDANYEGWSLWTRELTGGEPRELLRMAGGYEWGYPRFSPQGDAVVFVDSGNASVIELVHLPSGELEVLDSLAHWSPPGHVAPSFSGDGRTVLFASAEEVITIDLDTRERTVLHEGTGIATPAFSPTGLEVAFTERVDDAVVASIVTTQGAPIVRHVWQATAGVGPLSWSPEGTRIGLVDYEEGAGAVVRVIDAAAAEQISVVLLTAGLIDFAPTWSPDGSSLLTTAFDQPNGGGTVRWLDTESGESNDILWLGTGISGGHPLWLTSGSLPL